jgi:pilus assembly protein CpaE
MKVEQIPALRMVLVLTRDSARLAWLREVLKADAVVVDASEDANTLMQQISDGDVQVLVVDCSGANPHLANLADIAASAHPRLQLFGMGAAEDRDALMAAMRMKVADFLRFEAQPSEVGAMLRTAMTHDAQRQPRRRAGRIVVVVSGHPHAGTSTLTVNLAASLSRCVKDVEALVLDFGAPVGDCLTYMGLSGKLSFAEGLNNLSRCDKHYLRNGIASRGSISVLPLFNDAAENKHIKPADAYQFLGLLASHYGLLIADLGGAESGPVSDYLLRHADQVVVVSEQSATSLLAMQKLLPRIKAVALRDSHIGMLVNRYDPAVGLSPDYLSKTLDLPLWGVVPERRAAVLNAMNGGQLMIDAAPRDAWVKALERIVPRLGLSIWEGQSRPGHGQGGAADNFWRRLMSSGPTRLND